MRKHIRTGLAATTGALALLACISGPAEAAVQITGQVQAGGGAVANLTVTLWSATAGDPKHWPG
jgi:ABC-type glycerol-3-phosphate transport system substrate-binding protein